MKLDPRQPPPSGSPQKRIAWALLLAAGVLLSLAGLTGLAAVAVWAIYMDPRRSTESMLIRLFIGGAVMISVGAFLIMTAVRMRRA